MFVRILKKKKYLKLNHSISIKVSEIYINLCMYSNGDVHTAEGIPLSFGDSTTYLLSKKVGKTLLETKRLYILLSKFCLY